MKRHDLTGQTGKLITASSLSFSLQNATSSSSEIATVDLKWWPVVSEIRNFLLRSVPFTSQIFPCLYNCADRFVFHFFYTYNDTLCSELYRVEFDHLWSFLCCSLVSIRNEASMDNFSNSLLLYICQYHKFVMEQDQYPQIIRGA